ncbi:MAG: hypothetical protein AB7S26_20460 [Sandaracinaceae bacterium]
MRLRLRSLRSILAALAVLAQVGTGCGGEDAADPPASPAAPATPTAPTAPTEPALLGDDVPTPAGLTLAPVTLSGVTLRAPSGEGWTSEPNPMGSSYYEEASDTTVMIQIQSGVPALARGPYVEGMVGANERDAPGYAVTGRADGSIAGVPAARIDGTFDNGTAYATRDYVVFTGGNAVAIMARAPTAGADTMHAVVDAVAATVGR